MIDKKLQIAAAVLAGPVVVGLFGGVCFLVSDDSIRPPSPRIMLSGNSVQVAEHSNTKPTEGVGPVVSSVTLSQGIVSQTPIQTYAWSPILGSIDVVPATPVLTLFEQQKQAFEAQLNSMQSLAEDNADYELLYLLIAAWRGIDNLKEKNHDH